MKTKFIISNDGAKIAYNVFGQGFPIVLVHGMGKNKEMWVDRKWVELLKDNFTVITIDTRGNGESDKSYDPEFYAIDNIISDINNVVKECGFNEFNYFGHSYGGTIGLQLCKRNKNIKKIVCAGTTFGDEFFKEVVPKWIREYSDWGVRKKNGTLKELNLCEEDIEWIKNTDIDLSIAQLKAWNKWTGVNPSDININLAIYSGTNDDPQVVNNLNKNKSEIENRNIKLRIFENLNHVELVSSIDIVSPWVLDFLLN